MCGVAAFSATVNPPSRMPPRVLLVMPDRWPRALLRAALCNVGYDAVGASNLGRALRVRAAEPDRGPVRLVIVDQSALPDAGDAEQLARLLARHGAPATMLLARVTVVPPVGNWLRVLRRPVSVADIVTATAAMLPLPVADRRPLD
jgi:hypothetical protein